MFKRNGVYYLAYARVNPRTGGNPATIDYATATQPLGLQNPNVGLYPARLGNTANNWIGRSQNAAEPYFSGLVDDFRIYQRGLTAAEIDELVKAG